MQTIKEKKMDNKDFNKHSEKFIKLGKYFNGNHFKKGAVLKTQGNKIVDVIDDESFIESNDKKIFDFILYAFVFKLLKKFFLLS